MSWQITRECDGVDWHELSTVYTRAPLPVEQDAGRLQRAYGESNVIAFAYDGPRLIGAVRGMSDRTYFAVICDLVVDSDYQKQGVGRCLIETVLADIGAAKVMLASVPGQQGFYRKLGFLRHRNVLARYPSAEWYVEQGILEEVE
jgi:predicted N-acetyltransferase YhbS